MRAKTAKLVNQYARQTGQGPHRRAMKRKMAALSEKGKVKMKADMRQELYMLQASESLKKSVQEDKTIRRRTLAGGSGVEVLWFASDSLPGEASIYYKDGPVVEAVVTHPEITTPIPKTEEAFLRMWEIAIDEPLPDHHQEALNEYLKWRSETTEAPVI